MANKQWTTEPINGNDKLNTVYYSPKKNIAPIKKKKKKKKDFLDIAGDVVETAGKTALSAVNYLGQGTLKVGEQVLDTALQIGSSKYNPYYMLHPEKLKSNQAIAKELVGKDATKELITTLSGDENFNQNFLDKGSLVKSTNLGGKVLTGIGEMLPSIATGGITKAAITTGITGYGSGIETAYKDGASRSKANLYGLGSAAINSATEMITGGIPGVKTKWLSGLDKVAEKGISKVGNEIAKSLIRAGYKTVGEGGEEAIAEMLDPYLKNITYDKNAKIDWQNVIDSAVQGALIGGILNLPGTIGDVKQSIQTEKAKPIQNKPVLPISSPIEQQTNKVDMNVPTIQNKPLELDNKLIEKENVSNIEITQPIDNQIAQDIPFNKQTGEVIDPIKPIKEIPKIAKLVDAKPVEIDKSVGNKVKDSLQLTVNKGYYIDDYSEKSGNKEIKFKYDKMLSSDAEGQYEIAIGQTNNEGKIIGKSISDIWKPINDSGKKVEFSDYLLHKHNIDRMAQGKPIFGEDVTADMSKQKVNEYEANNPEFVDWSKDINTFNKNQLQNMVDAGLTSTETQELLNSMYDNYIRIQRDIKTGTAPITSNRGNVKIKNPLQKAKGGSQDILPLDESMAAQALQVKNVIRRNDLGLEMLKTSGGTITDSTNVLNKTEDGKYTFTVFKEGQPISIEVSEGIYNGLSNDLKNQIKGVEDKLSFATKPIQKLAQLQRSVLTTSNPFFIATNFFKDFQDGAFNSKYSRKFVKNYAKAISEMTKKGDLWNLYQANGGNQNTYFDYKTGFKKGKKNVITKSIEKIQNINEIIEQAPRLAEFISTIEDGKSVTEAMYNAAEITTNFKRGGDITKALNRNGANFLNASIQGFDKQIRNIKGENGLKGYVSLLAKATVWGILPSLLNNLIYEDDDDYKKLTSDTKDRYFLFKTSNNNFIKIPKGRVLSIFGSAARRTLETPNGSEKNTKEFLNLIINQVSPNNPLEDNVLAPITQAIKNETWYGGEIVPQRLQDELAKNQYDETTDAFSKWLGSKINVSPKKINYVLDQYSGGIGDIILPLSTKQAEQNPISAKFTVNSIMSNKNVGEFFDTKEKLTKIANDSKANEEDILKSKYMNSVQAKANDLYKEKRDIQNSDLTDKEKTKELRKIQSEINDMFTNALEEYKKPNIKSNYASIGDSEFYKKDNEWKKVSQDMSEKNNELEELDFDKNEYYKNYAKTSDIYNKKIGTLQKKSDIIDVIKNSGLNNKQKAYMYTKYYSSKENTDIINKLNINFDEYLKLEAQNIEATTNTIGTKVLRERKANYISTVNKLNLTVPQKALLIKNEYSSYDKYNNEIIKYVNNSSMTLNEKKSYLIELGFKIKNGKVSW